MQVDLQRRKGVVTGDFSRVTRALDNIAEINQPTRKLARPSVLNDDDTEEQGPAFDSQTMVRRFRHSLNKKKNAPKEDQALRKVRFLPGAGKAGFQVRT